MSCHAVQSFVKIKFDRSDGQTTGKERDLGVLCDYDSVLLGLANDAVSGVVTGAYPHPTLL